jgi:Flavodoxin
MGLTGEVEVVEMRAVVIYESMYGNTHLVAEAIARGLGPGNDVAVVPVAGAAHELLDKAALVVVGAPTHMHGMSRTATRKAAVEQAHKRPGQLTLDAGAEGPGLRDWFGSLGRMRAMAAAFDTRLAGPAVFTGRASRRIAGLLEQHGLTLIARAESFLITTDNTLQPGEEDRAQEWGKALAARMMAATGARS